MDGTTLRGIGGGHRGDGGGTEVRTRQSYTGGRGATGARKRDGESTLHGRAGGHRGEGGEGAEKDGVVPKNIATSREPQTPTQADFPPVPPDSLFTPFGPSPPPYWWIGTIRAAAAAHVGG